MSKLSQPWSSYFVSKALNVSFPSDILVYPVHCGHTLSTSSPACRLFFFVFQTIDHNVTCEHLGRQKLPNVICQPVHHHSMKELKVDPWCNLNPSVPSTSTLPFCPHTVPVLRHPHILLYHTWLPHKAFSRSRNTQCVSFRPPFYLSINTVVLSLLFIHQLLKVLPSSQHLATWLTQLAVIQLTSSICQSIPESSMTTSVWLLLII